MEQIGSQLLVWADGGAAALDPLTSAAFSHLDGTLTLSQLASDVAHAVDVAFDEAAEHLVRAARQLSEMNALLGFSAPRIDEVQQTPSPAASPSPADAPLGESTVVDLLTGDEVRVVRSIAANGDEITVHHHPDGHREMWTMISTPPTAMLADIASGDRSLAEQVPPDTCLGSKLRNSDDIPLVDLLCPDGRVRSVRVANPVILEQLRELAKSTNSHADLRGGPVEAFVVDPLEGCGPPRIYDGMGRRRGRPRSTLEIASVVDEILAEKSQLIAQLDANGPLPLEFVLLRNRSKSALVQPHELLRSGEAERLRRRGWTLSWVGANFGNDGTVSRPSIQPVGAAPKVEEVTVWAAYTSTMSPAERALASLRNGASALQSTVTSRDERQIILRRMRHFVESVTWRDLDRPLSEAL